MQKEDNVDMQASLIFKTRANIFSLHMPSVSEAAFSTTQSASYKDVVYRAYGVAPIKNEFRGVASNVLSGFEKINFILARIYFCGNTDNLTTRATAYPWLVVAKDSRAHPAPSSLNW